MPGLIHAPGIDIVFIPSGIRLIMLMIGGSAAAVEVSIGSLFLAGPEFGISNVWVIAIVALCTGLCPYVALLATQRLLGVSRNLENIRPVHLPLIALGVAAGSAVLHNLLFWALRIEGTADLPGHTLAMATGDFTGSLVAVAIVFGLLRLRRGRKL